MILILKRGYHTHLIAQVDREKDANLETKPEDGWIVRGSQTKERVMIVCTCFRGRESAGYDILFASWLCMYACTIA